MIQELAGKNLFHKDNPIFKKYFINKTFTENEKNNIYTLTTLILEFYKKTLDKEQENINIYCFDYDFCDYGYIDNYGYYTVLYDGWNNYFVRCYGDDINSVFYDIAGNILSKESLKYENDHRSELKIDYKTRFNNLKYDNAIPRIEYELNRWSHFYDNNIPDEIIKSYQTKLSLVLLNNSVSFEYDKDNNRVVLKQNNSKIKKLIK